MKLSTQISLSKGDKLQKFTQFIHTAHKPSTDSMNIPAEFHKK